jgi:hypothetical protein
MAKKIETEQPAYGQAQVLDGALQAAEQATPTPPPGDDAQAVQAALAEQAATPEQAQETPVNQAQTQPGGTTVKNRFLLLPPNVNFQAQQSKTPLETNYGMGLYWDIFAGEAQVDPTVRLIAKAYKTGGRG